MRIRLIDSYEHRFRPFSEAEAWQLFRLSAYGEAIGWTLLITGMALKQFLLHGDNRPVLVAGQLHGMLFLLYAAAAIVLYPSLRWSRYRAFIAGLASVPPYGSLLFELWESHRRSRTQSRTSVVLTHYQALVRQLSADV